VPARDEAGVRIEAMTDAHGENTATLALHRAAGFRVLGIRERIGQHHGRWRDTLLLERRSQVV